MRTVDSKFIRANKHLFSHKKCVFVVGAGISVGSGIPDFRSPTGIFATLAQQLKIHGRSLFMYDFGIREGSRKIYLKYISSLKKLCDRAFPNETHRFLANYPRSRTYTQNIDGLEERAGMSFTKHSSTSGVYLHGNLSWLSCQYCGFKRVFTPEDESKFELAEEIECSQCCERRERCLKNGMRRRPVGYMHPGIIHYQQTHPDSAFIGRMCERDMDCDLLIVMGTSLAVDGVKKLVKMFSRCSNAHGKRILVNLTPPNKEWNDMFDFFFHGDCKDFVNEVSVPKSTGAEKQCSPHPGDGVASNIICSETHKTPDREEPVCSKSHSECDNDDESSRGTDEGFDSSLGLEKKTIDSMPKKTTEHGTGFPIESEMRRISVTKDARDFPGTKQSLEDKLQDLSRTFSDEECIFKPVLNDALKSATPTGIQNSTFIDLEEEISSIVSKSICESDLGDRQKDRDRH